MQAKAELYATGPKEIVAGETTGTSGTPTCDYVATATPLQSNNYQWKCERGQSVW